MSDSLHFARYFFKLMNGGKKFVVGKHHRMICDKLNDVLTGKTRRLIINIAPRYSKSELVSRNFIAMGLAINPAAKFIHLSYSGDLALGNSVAVKDIVKSEDYQRLFGVEIAVGTDTKTSGTPRKAEDCMQPHPSDRLLVSVPEQSRTKEMPGNLGEPLSLMTPSSPQTLCQTTTGRL